MLEPDKAGKEQILRFIQEAQVTSQLEHPSIVPVHELGVDGGGNVFYTMKFVKGRSLKDIIKGIKEGDKKTIDDYPLSHLLTIFQKVCDAIAFAHSKRVIHRDLKPENVMVGEYGEVQVMDWGLAKVLPRKKVRKQPGFVPPGTTPRRTVDSGPSPAGIDSVRGDEVGDVLNTMDGQIMGTPGFMSPEQALGKTEEIDTRTDIYALGAILYNILTLEVPVKATSLSELIEKVTSGNIRKPTEYNDKRIQKSESRSQNEQEDKSRITSHVSLPHLPDNRVPESLSAVAMKALHLDPWKRYQWVKDLQKDIEAYQGGYATKAEDAGAWKHLRLFIERHKTVSMLVAAFLVAVVVGIVVSTTQWIRAEKSSKVVVEKERLATAALAELKNTAPALIAQAKVYVEKNDCERALKTVIYATSLVPDNAEYWSLKGNILQILQRLKDAEDAYDKALQFDPAYQSARENKDLCRKILEENKASKELPLAATFCLFLEMRAQGRFEDALATMLRVKKGGAEVETFVKGVLKKDERNYNRLKVDEKGLCELELGKTGISDLSILKGMPIRSLSINDNPIRDITPLKGLPLTWLALDATQVYDLTPLKGMPLRGLSIRNMPVADLTPLIGMQLDNLNIQGSSVVDLSPLKGVPLRYLACYSTRVADLSPLKGMPLKWLLCYETKVTDLTPLQGLPLEGLNVRKTVVSDLTPLRGMPLKQLDVSVTLVSDLSPLKGMALSEICFTPGRITNGIDAVREMKTLTKVVVMDKDESRWAPAEFWKKYDAGEFK